MNDLFKFDLKLLETNHPVTLFEYFISKLGSHYAVSIINGSCHWFSLVFCEEYFFFFIINTLQQPVPYVY